jgi:serine/threonine protein kinase/serine/threonine protein phosphatase PrpC
MAAFLAALLGLATRLVRPARAPQAARLEVGPLLARGSYGAVHAARLHDSTGAAALDVVAKAALAELPAEAGRAAGYLAAEASVNEAMRGTPGVCGYLGETTAEGERYLLFDRVRPLSGGDGPATSCADLLQTSSPWPITPREVLRQLLCTLSRLHAAGYLHRDIKLENLLLDGSGDGVGSGDGGGGASAEAPASAGVSPGAAYPSVKLVDFGSAVSVEGCDLFARMFQGCELDSTTAPCSELYAPEAFADPEHPFSFDVFSAGICFLRLSWPAALRTDAAVAEFRQQLSAAGGDLERWIRIRLQATVLREDWLEGLSSFPGADPAALALVRAMLHVDPAARPSADALLAHPFLQPERVGGQGAGGGTLACGGAAAGGGGTAAVRRTTGAAQSAPASSRLALDELLAPECRLPGYAVRERPLAIRLSMTKPLGLLLGEIQRGEGGGLGVDEILEGGSAAASGQLRVGDRLVAVGEQSLRGAEYNEAMAVLQRAGWGGKTPAPVECLFERACGEAGCDVPDPVGEARGIPLVVDSGSFASIGRRAHMEDAFVLTSFTASGASFTATERSFTLAAVFDGHRGGAASAHARATLADAVAGAIAAGEPSPLAVAWRGVVDGYLRTGAQDGATASALLLDDRGMAECLNCGDSRSVLSAGSPDARPRLVHASADHGAGDEAEVARIRASGGLVECAPGGSFRVTVDAPSVGGDAVFRVAVARALGGSEWLAGRISNAADVATLSLPADTSLAVVATDGLWGVLDGIGGSEEAARRVDEARREGSSAGEAAQQLGTLAKRMGSDDNCAVLVLYFNAS